MCDPPVEERLARLNTSLGKAVRLTNDTPMKWENGCEQQFSEFRITCVHLRREVDALDTVEDKDGAWKFIVKFCQARPFLHDRGNEVIRILMKSDMWLKAFAESGLTLDDVPPNIREEFKKRVAEVVPDFVPEERDKQPGQDPAAGGPADPGGDFAPMRPANMAVVVQRCSKARVLLEERVNWYDEIGHGLVVSVSFTKGAKEEAVHSAARFLLTAKLSTKERWEPGAKPARASPGGGRGDAESVTQLCRSGVQQGVLVLPQESLCSEVDKDNVGLQYDHSLKESAIERLYKAFVDSLNRQGLELIGTDQAAVKLKVLSAPFSGRQYYEMTTAGPFMHAFNF